MIARGVPVIVLVMVDESGQTSCVISAIARQNHAGELEYPRRRRLRVSRA